MLMLIILLATFIVSLISLIGIFFIGMKQDTLTKVIKYLVSFAVGGLLVVHSFTCFPNPWKQETLPYLFMSYQES
jgi:hypothetical protein